MEGFRPFPSCKSMKRETEKTGKERKRKGKETCPVHFLLYGKGQVITI
jgi:hypothetical protein